MLRDGHARKGALVDKSGRMSGDIHTKLLMPEGMEAARTALIARYQWFVHQSSCEAFESIQRTGLERRRDAGPPELVAKMVKDNPDHLVFLNPLGSNLRHDGTGEPPRFRMAVSSADIPKRPGLDWSMSYYPWNLAAQLKGEQPNRDNADIFVECVQRSGSVLFYDPIPPSVLRVCPKANPNADPLDWPALSAVTCSDIAEFD
jgi:hypothetical protein